MIGPLSKPLPLTTRAQTVVLSARAPVRERGFFGPSGKSSTRAARFISLSPEPERGSTSPRVVRGRGLERGPTWH
jgi:hypothetical protein